MSNHFPSGLSGVNATRTVHNYVGCFQDSRHQRVLNGLAEPFVELSMNVEMCISYCAERDFHFAGLQFR